MQERLVMEPEPESEPVESKPMKIQVDINKIYESESRPLTDEEVKQMILDSMQTCNRCGHRWIPRSNKPPKVCPNPACKSPYWNKPRKRRIK